MGINSDNNSGYLIAGGFGLLGLGCLAFRRNPNAAFRNTFSKPTQPLPKKLQSVKEEQAKMSNLFNEHASKNEWSSIRNQNYAFPRLDAETACLSEREVELLKSDPEFMTDYRNCLEKTANTWGYDLTTGGAVRNQRGTQMWNSMDPKDAPVTDQVCKLESMIKSAESFGEYQAKENLVKFRDLPGVQDSMGS